MLKSLLYFNVVILFVFSCIFVKNSVKKIDLQKTRNLIFAHILALISSIIILTKSVVLGFELIFIMPIFALSILINICNLIYIFIKLKSDSYKKEKDIGKKKYFIYMLLPAFLIFGPFLHESYFVKTADYVLVFHPEGFVSKEYYVINNDKNIKKISLNEFEDDYFLNHLNTEVLYFYEKNNEIYNDDSAVVKNEKIRNILLDAKKKSSEKVNHYEIEYDPKYDIFFVTTTFREKEDYPYTVIGEYIYQNNKFIGKIDPSGYLDCILCFK